MPTDIEIESAFSSAFYSFANSLSMIVVWDGDEVNTDGLDNWFEFTQRNNNYDPFLSDPRDIKRGHFQIDVCGRKKKSSKKELSVIAKKVKEYFPKGTVIIGTVQVIKTPDIMGMLKYDNRNTLPVTIEYHE